LNKLLSKLLLRKDSRLDITILAYRQTFLRDETTRRVFVWLLERCGMFKRVDNDEQRILHNWGIELMENMGLIQGLNYDRLVESMQRLTIPKEALDSAEGDENG